MESGVSLGRRERFIFVKERTGERREEGEEDQLRLRWRLGQQETNWRSGGSSPRILQDILRVKLSDIMKCDRMRPHLLLTRLG